MTTKEIEIVLAGYGNRDGRHAWMATRFGGYLSGSVLGVGGGGERALARYLKPNAVYTEVDIAGAPDVKLDLERELPLPFASNTFDCVVCTEVLEHVNNLHDVFDELLRVSREFVLISLPNCPIVVLRYLMGRHLRRDPRKHGMFSKYYGLPLGAYPDRHKWFFSASEIVMFFEALQVEKSYSVIERVLVPSYSGAVASLAMGVAPMLGLRRLSHDFSGGSLWVVLRKDATKVEGV